MGKDMGVSEVHALSHHPTLNSLCLSYPDPLTSTTHFFLWSPCITDTQNYKRLIMCFSDTVCGLWRELLLKGFYFYLLLLFISIFRSAHSICALTQVTLRQTRNVILVK